MTTEEARKALNEMKELVDNYVFDPVKRTYYGIAIDTAINGMTSEDIVIEPKKDFKDHSWDNVTSDPFVGLGW